MNAEQYNELVEEHRKAGERLEAYKQLNLDKLRIKNMVETIEDAESINRLVLSSGTEKNIYLNGLEDVVKTPILKALKEEYNRITKKQEDL